MPYLGIDSKGNEIIYEQSESRMMCPGNCPVKFDMITLPKGSIEKLTGRKLKKGDEPIKYFN